MKKNYNDCLTRLLKDEGGYSNDSDDSGGATNFGITIADYRKYINPQGTPHDVKEMSIDEARSIYRSKYWDALECDSLPSGVDYTCFDYGVNSGLGRPRKALQRFSGQDASTLIDSINNERTAFLEEIGHGKNAKFEAGWQARVKRVKDYSHYLSSHTKDVTTGPVIGTATGGTIAGLSQYWHQHQTALIIGAIVAALAVGTVIHYFKNKGN